MDIYSTNNYRKIWEHFNGPIPKDQDGRSYEIHHIDGNRKNNHIDNLQCVPIQEHYDIHYSQGDWAACHRIAAKMKLSPELISELASKSANDYWSNPESRIKKAKQQKEHMAKGKNKKILSEKIKAFFTEDNRNLWSEKMSQISKNPETIIKRKQSAIKRWSKEENIKEASNKQKEYLSKQKHYCEHCNIEITGDHNWNQHIKSKKHLICCS